MRLQPRHYVLCAVVIAIFVFNIVRNRQHKAVVNNEPAPIVVHNGPTPQSPGWQAFDHAAGLRDASAEDFAPALQALQQQIPTDPDATDLRGCLTWLEFYRQGMAQARADAQMKDRSIHHIAGCTRYHLDTTANP